MGRPPDRPQIAVVRLPMTGALATGFSQSESPSSRHIVPSSALESNLSNHIRPRSAHRNATKVRPTGSLGRRFRRIPPRKTATPGLRRHTRRSSGYRPQCGQRWRRGTVRLAAARARRRRRRLTSPGDATCDLPTIPLPQPYVNGTCRPHSAFSKWPIIALLLSEIRRWANRARGGYIQADRRGPFSIA